MTLLKTMASVAADEWKGVRFGLVAFMFVIIVLLAGGHIEGRFYPVLTDIKIGKADRTADEFGKRICFDISLNKRRRARGVYYVAQVYQDDQLYPAIRGVEHRDGTPFGLHRANSPPTIAIVDFCVNVAHLPEKIERVGIRMFIEWEVPHGLWAVRQAPIWIDYYPDKT